MGRNMTGYTKTTRDSLTLNAGVVFRDFIVGVDTYESAIADGKLLGATQGGTNFTATMETENFEIDNADPIINKTGTVCTMVTNFVDFSAKTIAISMGTGVAEDFNEEFDIIRARRIIEDDDYFDNICILTTRSGTDSPLIIEMQHVIATAGIAVNSQPKSITLLPVTFTASMKVDKDTGSSADSEYDPYTIYLPKIMDKITIDDVRSDDTVVTGTGIQGATVTIKGGTIPKNTTGVVDIDGTFSIIIPAQKVGIAISGYQTIKNRSSLPIKIYVKAVGADAKIKYI